MGRKDEVPNVKLQIRLSVSAAFNRRSVLFGSVRKREKETGRMGRERESSEVSHAPSGN